MNSINRASLSRRTIANRTGLTRARFVFSLYGLSKEFVLKFQDYQTAQQFLDMVETTREARATSEPAIRSRCKTCSSVLDVQGRCPSCGVRSVSMWKPSLLSALLPGLGQIYNGELSKGCLYIIIYGLLIISLIVPVSALVHRFAAVDMPDLVESIVIAFFVWLMSLVDAIRVAHKNRHRRWGLKL